MKLQKHSLLSLLLVVVLSGLLVGQQTTASQGMVPRLVNYTGRAADAQGRTVSGVAGVTFAIYKDQSDGAPLWMETQNVAADAKGNFTAQLGATKPTGLPLDLFSSGEARWLGVRVNGSLEQPRVLLLSVPYALKAADAETFGGLPPSAFVLAAPAPDASPSLTTVAPSGTASAPPTNPAVTGVGAKGAIPLWDSTSDITSSAITQTGSGTTARVGINVATPSATLDVKGTSNFRGPLDLPSAGLATASAGTSSYPLLLTASAFNTGTAKSVTQNFRWQAEPVGNDTANANGKLNLLFYSGSNAAAETGLSVASNGQITFAPGQTFPGGSGTITGVTAGTDLTGGGTSGNVKLSLDTTKVPQLNTANIFTGNQTVNGNLSSTGVVTGSSFQVGTDLFGFGSHVNGNAFLGFSGNTTMTGEFNTALGGWALANNTTGSQNTSIGTDTLFFSTGSSYNTAVGSQALVYTVGIYSGSAGDGSNNTAVGYRALYQNTYGSTNTAVGSFALSNNTTGQSNTANGYGALWHNTLGASNEASGYAALASNLTGGNDTASGAYALNANSTGSDNTSVGTVSLEINTTGYGNTAVGVGALGSNQTGFYLTCIGYGCGPTADNLHDSTAIGAHALVSVSDALVLGSIAGANGATSTTKVGIGTAAPTAILTIGRGAGHPVSDSWETYSSRRWKTNIQTLPNALSKVEHLRGVSYDLKDSGKHEIGVTAEEVGAVVPELVTYEENGKDARGVDYSRLTALLIEATKEQQQQIQRQQAVLRAQTAAIRGLKSELQQTRQTLQKLKADVAATHSTLVAEK